MKVSHVHKESTCTEAVPELHCSFWSKEPVANIEAFCNATRYKLNIVSSTQFKLVKE